MFGTGYAGAEDRLFLMDVLRHTAEAQLASFVGGSPSNRAMDETQWGIAPYTQADLQWQIDLAPKLLRRRRARSWSATRKNYVDGDQRLHPDGGEPAQRRRLMPSEYAALGPAPAAVEADRRDRRGVVDRRHLRTRRRRPGQLGDRAREAPAAARQARRTSARGATSARPTTPSRRARSSSSDSRTSSATRSLRRAWRCPTPGSVTFPAIGSPSASTAAADRSSASGPLANIGANLRGGAAEPDPRLELGAGLRASLSRRSRPRGDGSAGRLLHPRDPDGGGPARPRDRRSGCGVPRRKPVRRARPRPRLRLERDHLHLRQRLDVRRGALPGRLPLPVPGPVPADGEAASTSTRWHPNVLDRPRPAPRR